jgi:hypothetical protein
VVTQRRIFVSYHHDSDRAYYDEFAQIFSGTYEILHDRSVDRPIGSEDPEYVIRRIRENYLTGSSVTVMLCGRNSWGRKYVDWEILASLNQGMGLISVNLPTNLQESDGSSLVPDRFYDNWQSGYALWQQWQKVVGDPLSFRQTIETALRRSTSLIDNGRAKRLRNEPLR